ncbi:MAG: hypothetical protein OXU98_04285 [Gammaproteobacteria bacterium]|nr:hypothetical protein [Gammaproteobacteria bacterium]
MQVAVQEFPAADAVASTAESHAQSVAFMRGFSVETTLVEYATIADPLDIARLLATICNQGDEPTWEW